jgi:hypothetical protein
MLREITAERSLIEEAMAFAFDHTEYVGEIVSIIVDSLILDSIFDHLGNQDLGMGMETDTGSTQTIATPLPVKIARLYLVSDILHNSSAPVPNASAYRTEFETKLPIVFEKLNQTFRNIVGRITAEKMKVTIFSLSLAFFSLLSLSLSPPVFLSPLSPSIPLPLGSNFTHTLLFFLGRNKSSECCMSGKDGHSIPSPSPMVSKPLS